MTNITCGQLVQREVICCVSSLISELAANEKYQDELLPVMSQDDYGNAAAEEGWEPYTDKFGVNCYRNKDDGATCAAKDWQECCEINNIDPQQNEAYEHWIVTDWLAAKLEERGEMVLRDFLGMTIWGRACTGQSIAMDSVIQRIHADLIGKAA